MGPYMDLDAFAKTVRDWDLRGKHSFHTKMSKYN